MSGRGQTDLAIYFKRCASIGLYVNWFSIVIVEEETENWYINLLNSMILYILPNLFCIFVAAVCNVRFFYS